MPQTTTQGLMSGGGGGPARIELHLRELAQLYNSMDPSPFHERDLDAEAEQYIVESAQELGGDARIEVMIHVDAAAPEEHEEIVASAIGAHFGRSAESARRQLRRLFQVGRVALIIGLSCVVASVIGGELIVRAMGESPASRVFRESLLIGGWVAMWRPMEIFLYDWWPIRNRRRVLQRLSQAPVRVVQPSGASQPAKG